MVCFPYEYAQFVSDLVSSTCPRMFPTKKREGECDLSFNLGFNFDKFRPFIGICIHLMHQYM